MPYSEDGIIPDLIINPNCIPSRMTIGQLVESLGASVASLEGIEIDGTPFQYIDIEDLKNRLENKGYERNGNRYLYNGMTGKKLKTMIFMTPVYYQRLKHMVSDKIHCMTSDHDVLTTDGWIPIDKVTTDHKVATLKKDHILDYEHPKKVLHYDNFKGQMYHISNSSIDLNVTDNHRMYVSTFDKETNCWSNFGAVEAKDLVGKHVRYLDLQLNIVDTNSLETIEKLYDYEGSVYCLEMPHETFYVRRNGKTCWTMNSRARGVKTPLTRQAPEGRARDGGFRFGEMERDCVITHGMSTFLKERMVELADQFKVQVCDKCGLFAQRMITKNIVRHSTKNDVYFCPACNNYSDISKVVIPYAFKLFIQELMAINVVPRIRTVKDI
jgi:hypothetical protein